MQAPIVRRATREDIEAFSSMRDWPTVLAWCGELDGRIIALGGFALFAGRWFAFADLTEEARRYKMHIMRTAKRIMADAQARGIKFVYTESQLNEPTSKRWLTSLGFELDPRSQYLYRWRNG